MKCQWCNGNIPKERVMAARSRGVEPKYCSTTCRGSANTAAYRDRKKK